MSRGVKLTQVILAMIAIALVTSLFLGGLVRGQNRDQPASPNSPGPTTPAPPKDGERMPGMPEKPISEHETFAPEGKENPDRQLTYAAQGSPKVEFLASLGSHEKYATQVVTWEKCEQGDGQCAR